MIRFEWDPAKAAINRRKHGVSFETARRVFADPFAVSDGDRDEGREQRWITLRAVENFLFVVVVHTTREEDENGEIVEVIRIISAREASRKERRRYEQESR